MLKEQELGHIVGNRIRDMFGGGSRKHSYETITSLRLRRGHSCISNEAHTHTSCIPTHFDSLCTVDRRGVTRANSAILKETEEFFGICRFSL